MEELRRLAKAMTEAIASFNEAKTVLLPIGARVLVDSGWQGVVVDFVAGQDWEGQVAVKADDVQTAMKFGHYPGSGDVVCVSVDVVELLDE